ncbi:MAG: hypothetical protein HGA67_00420 [Candidatus Yonathbacteria bacterium]|nr:hypothetical protein [Candidatus Yonathbacteria bacterium]
MEQTKQSLCSKVSPTARMFAVGIIGIIIGWGGYYLWDNRDIAKGNNDTPTAEENSENASDSITSEKPSMPEEISAVVGEQPEGMHVSVSSVTTDRTIWVAVREDTDGALGNILGAALVFPGTYEGVWIDLMRNTFAGQKYHVVIYVDDGDKVFDYTKDVMLPGLNGDGIIGTFDAIRI